MPRTCQWKAETGPFDPVRHDDHAALAVRGTSRESAFVIASLGLIASSCVLATDAATRLANDVVENASALRGSARAERVFVHMPRTWPSGCSGRYTVMFQASLRHPESGGSLLVGCEGDSNFRAMGYSYGTTYHLNAVRVPHELAAAKEADGTLEVTLRKQGRMIDVVAIR